MKIFAFSKRLFFFCFCYTIYSSHAQLSKNTFEINGKLETATIKYIYLSYKNIEGIFVHDSCKLEHGKFYFTGKISEPTYAFFSERLSSILADDKNLTEIFLEPTKMSIVLKMNDFKRAVIQGSKSQREMGLLQKQWAPVLKAMQPLQKEDVKIHKSLEKDENNNILLKKSAAIRDKLWPYHIRMRKIGYQFIASHPGSYISAYELSYYLSHLPLDSSKMFYKSLTPAIQNSYYGKLVAERIQKIESGSPGSVAKEFRAKDMNGDTICLSQFKNKTYVMLDFWASWCVPCRKSNPHLITIYNKYHDKGLDIIGISDDDTDTFAWRKAVEKDSIQMWKHILSGLDVEKRLKEEKNENDIGEKYGIHVLPTKILIDKNGVIIGHYEGSDNDLLDKKLHDIFK